MKKAEIVVRLLLGALFLFASIAFFLHLGPQPELTAPMTVFMSGIMASKYLLPLAKAVELLCGLAFVTGCFVPLAIIVIFPISVTIFFIHAFIAPEGITTALFVLGATLFLAYAHRESYKGLFRCE